MAENWTTVRGLTRHIQNVTVGFEVRDQTLKCDCPIDDFKRGVFPAAYLLIFVLGLTANSASMWVFMSMCRGGRRLSTVNLLLVNLLLSDLMLVCSLPLRAAYYLLDSAWPFGDLTCRLVSYVFYINMYGSVYFLLALSVLRYLAVCHPFKFLSLDVGYFGCGGCLLIWLFVSLACVPLLLAGSYVDKAGRTRCLELGPGLAGSTIILLNQAALVLGFALPFAVISVCYMCVLLSLCQSRAGVKGMRRPSRRKSFALVIVVLFIFMVCFLPYHVVRTIFLEAERHAAENVCRNSCSNIHGIRKAAVITLCLAAVNSCLDPFIFFFVGEDFRDFCMKKGRRWRRPVDNVQRQRAEIQELQPIEVIMT